MNTKLTLNLDKAIIAEAKRYAKNNRTSLSKLIENYLGALTVKKNKVKPRVSPLVESLTGVIPDLPEGHYKSGYHRYLEEKYS